jgi:hypothetical protein
MAICLELHQGPLVSALRQDAGRVLLPVHPLTLARDREAFTPSHAKDDPADADRPLERLLPPRGNRHPLTPQRPDRRAPEPRVPQRRRLVGDHVRLTHRLTRALKHDFPHGLPWLHDTDTGICCDVLAPWPTLNAVQLARRSTLERCCRDHPVRSADVITPRREAVKSATPLPTAAGLITPNARVVRALVAQRRVTLPAIAAFDKAIAPRAQRHPDCPLLDPLPGAGAVCAPTLLVACGEPRDRSASAAERPR